MNSHGALLSAIARLPAHTPWQGARSTGVKASLCQLDGQAGRLNPDVLHLVKRKLGCRTRRSFLTAISF